MCIYLHCILYTLQFKAGFAVDNRLWISSYFRPFELNLLDVLISSVSLEMVWAWARHIRLL